jgi:SAM-dependent methyltransferase
MSTTACLTDAAPPGSTGHNGHSLSIPATARKRQIVVVLGMHRSGTSLLANLLTVLGVDLGENLLNADLNNQAGYWEQKDICRTQDDLLQQLGRRWIGPAGTVPFPDAWWQLPEIIPFKERLTEILRAEISKAKGLWGFKDPRTSRLLPLWKEIFADLNLDPVYVLSVRDPAVVVESVVKRDEIPATRAELLWLLHNLDAVRDAGDQLRLVVEYDRWFTHPREQAQAVARALDLNGPNGEKDLLACVRERIRPDLRHCRTPQPLSLPFINETYDALKQASVTGRISPELRRLDESVRRALALAEPWAQVVETLTRKQNAPQFSFVENFSDGQLETLGETAQAAIWDAQIDGEMQRALFLHPPARLHFHVADGRRARLAFAVNVHPHAWDKPKAGGCEFIVTVNGTTHSSVQLDPVNVPSDRRWHECTLDIPESSTGAHDVIFETRALGNSLDYRWAVWREPRLTWESAAPDPTFRSSVGSQNFVAGATSVGSPNFVAGATKFVAAVRSDSSKIMNATSLVKPHLSQAPGKTSSAAPSLSANDSIALKLMARVHLNADRHEAARAMCRRVLLDNPKDREALDLLSKCHFDFESLDRNESYEENPGFLSPALARRVHHSPTAPAAASTPVNSPLQQLARHVGDDWKQQPYYDEAEAHMEKQWDQTIWPFIREADFTCVLDLAAGHGRNSAKLIQHAKKIYVVDINEENIAFCKNRFAGDPRFEFRCNDGCSLSFIPTNVLSLVYCFDAMVHFDSDVVRAYLREFARVLRPGGLGFCHHSNYTEHPGGDVHQNPGWRNFMSEKLFAHYCAKEGLRVVKSRVINWSAPGSDCVTLFRKQ